ncbi:MAG: glucose-1-phosphate cytidylyltransferase [Candidatus Helarchaeota archaeon]
MKVIIFAGGWGSRLGQRTQLIPKPMIRIGDKPILWHIMKIYSYYGYNDFIILLGVKGEIIKNFFYNYDILNNDFTINMGNNDIEFHKITERPNWRVTLVNTGLNTLKGGRLKRAEKYIKSEINMLTYGDGLANININELIEFHKSHGKILTITGVHPPSRFGELVEQGNKLISFEEKPQTSKGLINGGFMVFNRKLLNYLTEDDDCDFEHTTLGELLKDDEVMVYKHKGLWDCMDNERDYTYLNKLWNENKPFWRVW